MIKYLVSNVIDHGVRATGDDVKSNNGLFIRRARIVFAGQIHNVYFYIQPDIAVRQSQELITFSSYEMLISIVI
jgi:hypothetical protein